MELEQLIGGKIIEAGEDVEDGDAWPTLLVQLENGSLIGLVASRDEEGNGPGALFIEPVTLDQIEAA